MSSSDAAPPIPTATSTTCPANAGWSPAFLSSVTVPACAVSASQGSYQALQACCGVGATISTQQDNCVLYCEPKGVTLDAVNQCLFLQMGSRAPGYAGGIVCTRQGADFTSSIIGAAMVTGNAASSVRMKAVEEKGVRVGGIVVGWMAMCAVLGGLVVG